MMVGFFMLVVEVDEIWIDFRICIGYLDKKVYLLDEVMIMLEEVKKVDKFVFIGLLGNVVEVFLVMLV